MRIKFMVGTERLRKNTQLNQLTSVETLFRHAQSEICVGVIGATAKDGWAKMSHVLAINDLPGLRLAAVVTRNEQSAREAAKASGADRWYRDPFAMICDDQIDVVTVSVGVPAHRELVLAALEAGKAVFCESPSDAASRKLKRW